MRWLAILLFVATPLAAAEDPRLTELRAMLVPMRAPGGELPSRGATPEFTVIKHRLRDWIESKLEQVQPNALGDFEDRLNRELQSADLLCKDGDSPDYVPDCPEQTELGFLKPIKVRGELGILTIQTGIGIQNCGFDESAYAYRWHDKWERFWQSEQDDYTEAKYNPQRLYDVLISPIDWEGRRLDEYLILTLATESWCTSNLSGVYYRAWQTKPGHTAPKLLLDESEAAMRYFAEPIHGSVGTAGDLYSAPGDVWVEYTVPSLGAETREEIRHYRLIGDKLERIDPVALRPRDFVDQWVEHRFDYKAGWTDAKVREKTQQWMPKPDHDGDVGARIVEPTFHCEQKPDLWQVKLDFQGEAKEPVPVYFLVRWQPPFHFAMVDFSNHPWPGCTQPDYVADHFVTLFR